jgi:hypothetical protein
MMPQTLSQEVMKSRLSALWTFVLINMLFADVFSFMVPGALQKIATGVVDGVQLTPGFLLIAAVLTEIPMAMIVLSRLLSYRANRWANILGGLFTILWVVGLGSATPHYIFIASIEVLCSGWIIWLAWRWRTPEGQTRQDLAFTLTTGD